MKGVICTTRSNVIGQGHALYKLMHAASNNTFQSHPGVHSQKLQSIILPQTTLKYTTCKY